MSESSLTPLSPVRAEEHKVALEAEWGTYVALVPISIDGVAAVPLGGAVPVSHVERGVVDPSQVAKITTKAGRAAAGIEEKG